MTDQSVQVKLELGHRAVVRVKPTPEGFTHDWSVFVRGPEGSNIQYFVQKVVFHLHDSFPKPKRSVKEPPYNLQESGYGGFSLPIDIYFRNKEEPRHIRFDYDLFLHLNGDPVFHKRCELLTFQNPTGDFRQKLLKAGGVILGGSGEVITPVIAVPTTLHTELFDAPVVAVEPRKKHKYHYKEKKSKVRTVSSGLTSGSSTPSSIGGASVQPSYPRHGGKGPIVDPATEKSPAEKDKSGLKHPTESALSPAVRDRNTPTVSSPAKRPADLALSPGAKCPSDVISPCSSSSSSAKKRRKEKDPSRRDKDHNKDHSSGKKSSHSHKDKSRSTESSKSKPHKSSKRDRKSTDSKPSHDGDRKPSSKSKPVATAARDESPPVAAVAPKLKVELLAFEEELSTGEQSEFDPFEDIAAGAALKPPAEKLRGRGLSALIAQLGEGDCDSDSHDELLSPLSASSPPVLFPEFQSSDHDENIPVGTLTHHATVTDSAPALKSEPDWLLPLATTPVSPLKGSPCSDSVPHKSPSDKYSAKKVSPLRLFPSSQEKPGKSKHDRPKKSKSDKKPPKEHHSHNYSKDKENEESNTTPSSKERKDVIITDQPESDRVATPVRIATEPDADTDASLLPLNQIDRSNQHAPNGESLSTLLDLQERLMMMTDARLLQKIVSIIEETGNYKINETTFDFDLYCLDRTTVQKLLDFLLQVTG